MVGELQAWSLVGGGVGGGSIFDIYFLLSYHNSMQSVPFAKSTGGGGGGGGLFLIFVSPVLPQ